jgi:hypothetical protein
MIEWVEPVAHWLNTPHCYVTLEQAGRLARTLQTLLSPPAAYHSAFILFQ